MKLIKTAAEMSFRLLIAVNLTICVTSTALTVDPPSGLQVIDPGHLGQLHLTWVRPSSLDNVTDCSVRYQLQYFCTSEERWRTIRTTGLTYSTQFDLEKAVRVRVQTLLEGPCTNNTQVLSPAAEVVLQPSAQGADGSRIKDLSCLVHRKEYMECLWEKESLEPPQSQRYLYYWHADMEQAAECPQYITSHGTRIGCSFPADTLLEFSEFNMCVNGSSAAGPLTAAYFSLEIQNHVKPAPIETLSLEASDGKVLLEWAAPSGKVPPQCLEYEVESREGDEPGENLQRYTTRDTSYNPDTLQLHKDLCFRVRSRLHFFCADKSFWSEWSEQHCLPGAQEAYSSDTTLFLLCVMSVCALTTIGILLGFYVVKRTWGSRGCSLTSERTPVWTSLGFEPDVLKALTLQLCQDKFKPFKKGELV